MNTFLAQAITVRDEGVSRCPMFRYYFSSKGGSSRNLLLFVRVWARSKTVSIELFLIRKVPFFSMCWSRLVVYLLLSKDAHNRNFRKRE